MLVVENGKVHGRPEEDTKRSCGRLNYRFEATLHIAAGILGVSVETAAFFLNTLETTAQGDGPLPELQELCGGLLAIVSSIQVGVMSSRPSQS